MASGKGHVEAVRALVELGAAVDQATVGRWDVFSALLLTSVVCASASCCETL